MVGLWLVAAWILVAIGFAFGVLFSTRRAYKTGLRMAVRKSCEMLPHHETRLRALLRDLEMDS